MKAPVGRVYVLTNPRMVGLVKIGFTLGTVEGRARELDATGTPEPFEIAYQVEVRGPDDLERRAHGKLGSKRVRNSREFFEIDVVEAILCVRSLANDPLGEECSPKYIELIDEAAERHAQDREKKELARIHAEHEMKVQRYEEFVREADELQHKKDRLQRELDQLKAELDGAPRLLELNWIEKNGQIFLIFAIVLLTLLSIVAYRDDKPTILMFVIPLVLGISIVLIWTRSSVRTKQAHNLPILRLGLEVRNSEFDLDKVANQKIRLPSDLSEFIPSNPIKADERGFEAAARKTGAFK